MKTQPSYLSTYQFTFFYITLHNGEFYSFRATLCLLVQVMAIHNLYSMYLQCKLNVPQFFVDKYKSEEQKSSYSLIKKKHKTVSHSFHHKYSLTYFLSFIFFFLNFSKYSFGIKNIYSHGCKRFNSHILANVVH